ncbi:MAG: putative baseplate assembly protein [Plectolyngbya sp. WJT66-NPBG17]|jgi:hypothetical protein|nr:putative baseplate assembly protein [Plectolyngbya sp. WJT66-NPBG17]
MVSQYRCQNQRRLQTARTQQGVNGEFLNGIDYLEVASDQKTLKVYLLHDLANSDRLTLDNLKVLDENQATIPLEAASSFGKLITIRLRDVPVSTPSYTLRLVESPVKLLQLGKFNPNESPRGFDPQLAEIRFSVRSFGASQSTNEIDCQPERPAAEPAIPPPEIDYLAKDYTSFRQLMLDRLTVTVPNWKERSPADIGVMLVEILAYAADHLSYHQDAVSTEAYLGTARKRVSVHRHARLLDYFMQEGCNARAWVVFDVEKQQADPQRFNPKIDGIKLLGYSAKDRRAGTRLFTKVDGLPTVLNNEELIAKVLNSETQIFEILDREITLYQTCNEIWFHPWGEETCSLKAGATRATLLNTGGKLQQCLTSGKVLLFEEFLNPETGEPFGIDLTRRHAVRLKTVQPKEDLLLAETAESDQPQRVVEVEWFEEDALPFELCISKRIDGKLYPNISIARGNVALVDHGRTRPDHSILAPQSLEIAKANANRNQTILEEKQLNRVGNQDRYRPRLNFGSLTQQSYILNQSSEWVLVDPDQPARQAVEWQTRDVNPSFSQKEYKPQEATREDLDRKVRRVRPSITLREYNAQEFEWNNEPDLLNSERFARDFVVETEDDERTYLRFGDDALGKKPEAGTYFEVTYRVGNGSIGNVGTDAIAHIAAEIDGIKKVRNPLPAQGGSDPESIEQVRLYAPQAFRVPQRAVTEKDYEEVAQRHPEVQRVKATRRWTGSWYTIFLTVDRKGGRLLDHAFRVNLRSFLEQFRMAGHDIEIEEPRFVPLDIAMKVQVETGYFRTAVKQALLEVFSNRVLSNQQLGFFAPDRLTFGQSVYLSQVIQAAVQVEGVRSVEIIRFQRLGRRSQGELKTGEITFAPLEIAQLDNNLSNPERGRIEFELEGGL